MDNHYNQIIEKYKDGTASEGEIQEFYTLFHHAEAEFDLKNRLIEDLEEMVPDKKVSHNLKKVFERILSKIGKEESSRKTRSIYKNPIFRYAAILVIGLLAGYFIESLFFKAHPAYFTALSPRGSVSELVLSDGSVVYLNSDSRLKYSMDGTDGIREVFLSGEAWFHVEKNTGKPFIVHTQAYDVKVTGTRFNVKAYNADIETAVTLEDGTVSIVPTVNIKFESEIVLKPGEQFVYNQESNTQFVRQVNTRWITSWKDNKLIFVNMKLDELFTILERKYGVEIVVKSKAILDYHYDGTIKNETILEILEIIKKTLPINYKIVDQKVEITVK
jgi:ferric-dicitrate binding protein FerR (iron transport regulator)